MTHKQSYERHYSVLLHEVLDLMQPEIIDMPFVGIDCTLGEAGHLLAMLKKWPTMHAVGCDVDAQMMQRAQARLGMLSARVQCHQAWFDDMLGQYQDYPGLPVRVIFMDLGVSMYHFVASGRGFSFNDVAWLDMRLSGEGDAAHDIVNRWSQSQLCDLFRNYGDEKEAYKMSKMIVQQRPFDMAKDLADAIFKISSKKHARIHPATKIFQAIRIQVNQELARLESAIVQAFDLLDIGGKLGIISFHSLEDRIVKNFFRDLARPCHCSASQMRCTCGGPVGRLMNAGGTAPTQKEVGENSASRSARLRVIQKLGARCG
ncbi:MAG: 16S rRNA (cytosine(1402)-N(4))-methyltransferase RsmH [Spirochaetia bacterium]